MESNNDYIVFQVSDNTFWGYRIPILRSTLQNIPENEQKTFACREVKNSLTNTLTSLNLRQLVDQLYPLNFHIHTHETISNVYSGLVYVCGHCGGNGVANDINNINKN
jgi:hypothetical protein